MRRSFGLSAAAAALVMIPSAFAASGAVAANTTSLISGMVHPAIDVVAVHHDTVTSTNWSGYAVADTSELTEVEGSWVQPAASCTELLGKTYAAFWVGLDGYTSTSVEQLGTDSDCTGHSSPSYYAWYEMYPADSVDLPTSTYPVSPGDTLTAAVSRTGTSYTLSLRSSRGWSFSQPETGTEANSSAEWIAEAPEICSVVCSGAKLTNFGTMEFTGAEAAAGGSLAPISTFGASSGPHEITMSSSTGTTRATPSALGGGGETFTDTWDHN